MLDRPLYSSAVARQSGKLGHPAQLIERLSKQVPVANEEEFRFISVLQPSLDMLMPMTGVELSLLQELQESAFKSSVPNMIMIVRDHNIPTITDNVHHSLELWIELMVSGDQPRRRHLLEPLAMLRSFHSRNDSMNRIEVNRVPSVKLDEIR
jgi:hypothetical protein